MGGVTLMHSGVTRKGLLISYRFRFGAGISFVGQMVMNSFSDRSYNSL